MKIISVISRKGGVGKTSTAHALGSGLLRDGAKVLFVDLDSQGNLTFSLQAKGELSSWEVMTGKADITDAIIKTDHGDILPGSESLAAADMKLNKRGKEYRLREALEPVKGNYDFCIIDTPASLGILTVNAITATSPRGLVIPVQADIYSLQGMSLLEDSIKMVREFCNNSLSIGGIILTRYNPRAVLSRDIQAGLEEIAEHMQTQVFKTQIRENISIKEAAAMQTDIYSYAKGSNGAKDYAAFVKEYKKIIGRG